MDQLISNIDKRINAFVDSLPEIEKKIYSSLLLELKDLSLYSDGSIKNNLENIKKIGRIKKMLDDIILNDQYLASTKEFIDSYSAVEKSLNSYFSTLSDEFTPKTVLGEVKNLAVNDAVEALTEAGISANISTPLQEIIKTNIVSGGSYANLTEQLRDLIISTPESDGSLVKYAKTYATDSVNTFSGSYMKIVTDDLGLTWYKYIGSIIKTSRPFCKALVEKKYIHESEIPEILKGHIDGKTVSLAGVKPETTPDNFQQLRGGWQCQHQLIPISEVSVPKEIRIAVYSSHGIKYNEDGFAIGK